MIPKLLLHDRLAPPKNHHAFWEVLDAQPRGVQKHFSRMISLRKWQNT